jgi:hypothetical protein
MQSKGTNVSISKQLSKMESEDITNSKLKTAKNMLKIYLTLHKQIGTLSYVRNVASICAVDYFAVKNLPDIMDADINVVNFKNGLLTLSDGKFRQRTHKDYFTKTLDFDYSTEVNKDITEKINNMIFQIANSNIEDTEAYKSYFGYCMTGLRDQQRAFFSVGHTASNGKTTLIEAFVEMFSIYTKKLDSGTFETNFNNKHKQFTDLKLKRFAYIEEMSRVKLNIQVLKDLIAGSTIGGNEVLYGTTEDIPIYFKLLFISNNTPNFKNDNGMQRRGMLMEHKNKFVSASVYENAKSKSNLFILDNMISENSKKPEFKLALFQILLSYATKYYSTKTLPVKHLIDNWSTICVDNDDMSMFINEYFEITNNINNLIFKDDFVTMYRNHYNLKNITWNNIMNDVKRLGIKYDRQKEKTEDGRRRIGHLIGIKLIAQIAIRTDLDDIDINDIIDI